MMTLEQYDIAAKKIICNYKRKKGFIHLSDELIGRVIRSMAVADWKYNASKGMSQYDFRQMRAIYAIREYLEEKKSNRYVSLQSYSNYDVPVEYDEKAAKKINFLVRNSNLNSSQYSVMQSYLAGSFLSQTAEQMGISYEQCHTLYKSAIQKMRRLHKDKKNVE